MTAGAHPFPGPGRSPRRGALRRIAATVAIVWMVVATPAHPALAAPAGDQAFDEGLQWGLTAIGAPAAWTRATGAGTVIAVVDSGVRLSHVDLAPKLVDGIACLDTDGDSARCNGAPEDDDGHGTHVAGIAAAATGNGVGIAGTAPDARVMPIKVLEEQCTLFGTCEASGTAEDVSAGIRWAADHGADVINLSLGSTTDAVFGPSFESAVDYAWSKGAIPVVASGNDFVLASGFSDQPAVVVSATDRAGQAPSYSNGVGAAKWAVAAPGGEAGDTAESCSASGEPLGVLSTWWTGDDSYACLSGTSMAAPHVSGALAILLSQGYSPADAVARLLDTATDIGPAGRDATYGAGLINLDRATGQAPPPTTSSTTRSVTSTTAARSTTTSRSAPTTRGSSSTPSSVDATSSTSGPDPSSPSTDGPATDFDDRATATTEAAGSTRQDGDDALPAGIVVAAIAAIIVTGAATTRALLRDPTA